MSIESFDTIDFVIIASVFGLVLTMWMLMLMAIRVRRLAERRKVTRRLDLDDVEQNKMRELRLWHDGQEAVTRVSNDVPGRFFIERLEQLRHDMGWRMPIATMLLAAVCLCLGAGMVTYLITANLLASVFVVAAVAVLLRLHTRKRIARTNAMFEQQLVDALELAARSLRAGHPLSGTFRLVADEIAAPVGPVFARICQQQDMGASLDDALLSTADQSNSSDLKLFATSVSIQLKSGGNLADMMDRLAYVIRDRFRLTRRVRVLTAQTQFSKNVLLGLPFVLFAVLNLLSPKYMTTLYETVSGQILLAIAGAGLLVGAWVMNRMVEIKA